MKYDNCILFCNKIVTFFTQIVQDKSMQKDDIELAMQLTKFVRAKIDIGVSKI